MKGLWRQRDDGSSTARAWLIEDLVRYAVRRLVRRDLGHRVLEAQTARRAILDAASAKRAAAGEVRPSDEARVGLFEGDRVRRADVTADPARGAPGRVVRDHAAEAERV